MRISDWSSDVCSSDLLGACDATTRARPWFQRWRPGERPWPRLRSRTMPVQGIGGLFFRARDPEGLADWYRRHLGIGAGCAAEGTGTPDEWFWKTEGGPVVFAPFKADSDYFAADKQWMLNLRVTDLEGLLEQLKDRKS